MKKKKKHNKYNRLKIDEVIMKICYYLVSILFR